jgi:SHS2 domain-containing protein
MEKYEYIPHTADVKFKAHGKTLEELFTNSALAMFNIMVETSRVKAKNEQIIKAEGADLQALLQTFLEQFLILIDTKNFFLSSIKKIEICKEGKYLLYAVAVGDDAAKYETLGPLVKACTYNDMEIKQEGKHWMARVLVDI